MRAGLGSMEGFDFWNVSTSILKPHLTLTPSNVPCRDLYKEIIIRHPGVGFTLYAPGKHLNPKSYAPTKASSSRTMLVDALLNSIDLPFSAYSPKPYNPATLNSRPVSLCTQAWSEEPCKEVPEILPKTTRRGWGPL